MRSVVRRGRAAALVAVVLVAGALALIPAAPASAVSCTWTDTAGDHLASTAGNWSGCTGAGGLPGAGDAVTIDRSLGVVTIDQPMSVAAVTTTGTPAGYRLDIDARVDVTGVADLAGRTSVSAPLFAAEVDLSGGASTSSTIVTKALHLSGSISVSTFTSSIASFQLQSPGAGTPAELVLDDADVSSSAVVLLSNTGPLALTVLGDGTSTLGDFATVHDASLDLQSDTGGTYVGLLRGTGSTTVAGGVPQGARLVLTDDLDGKAIEHVSGDIDGQVYAEVLHPGTPNGIELDSDHIAGSVIVDDPGGVVVDAAHVVDGGTIALDRADTAAWVAPVQGGNPTHAFPIPLAPFTIDDGGTLSVEVDHAVCPGTVLALASGVTGSISDATLQVVSDDPDAHPIPAGLTFSTSTGLLPDGVFFGHSLVVGGRLPEPGTVACDGTSGHLVRRWYESLLGRPADPAAEEFWGGRLDAGDPLLAVARSITGSTELARFQVTTEFERILLRTPDPSGLAFWTAAVHRGVSIDRLRAQLAGSAEVWRAAGQTANGLASVLYQRLLGRAPDGPGVDLVAHSLAAGRSRARIAEVLLASSEAKRHDARLVAERILGREPTTDELTLSTALLQGGTTEADLAARMASSLSYITEGPS